MKIPAFLALYLAAIVSFHLGSGRDLRIFQRIPELKLILSAGKVRKNAFEET